MFRASSGLRFLARPLTVVGVLAVAMGYGSAGAVTITEFALPNAQAMPISITGARDGNLWFTEFNANKIGKITPQGQITEFALTGPTYPYPVAITVALDGSLWFLEGDRIGKLTTAGTLSEYLLPFGYNSNALGIAAGVDGNVWFTESRCPHCDPSVSGQLPDDGATIGKISPEGKFTEFTLPDYHAGPRAITGGPDENLWFTETEGNKIGRITPAGKVTEFTLPVPNSFPMGITAGSDGNLWFVESRCAQNCDIDPGAQGNEVIGRITPAGVITEFPTSSRHFYNGPETIGIVEGADHNLWFTEPSSNKIGSITHAGVITEFDVPFRLNDPNIDPLASTQPVGISNGLDGNVWFVEAALNVGARIGKVDFASTPSPAAVTITSGFTGNWYNPNQSGHGFSLEVLRDNQMLADWYAFGPNGGQSWIVATGPISGNSAVLQGFQDAGPGGKFPPNFDPLQLHAETWGTITFSFTDCNNGQVSWQPAAAGYTSGSMPITRLTMPAGLSCQ